MLVNSTADLDDEGDELFNPEDELPCNTVGRCIGQECPEWGVCMLSRQNPEV